MPSRLLVSPPNTGPAMLPRLSMLLLKL
ncbi:Protein of unknown function [Thermobacillus xylanilyticus]|uniref:Uncharacterized protein n=1 Tax=Thermobacillus xylanilyticus TaxID=76633 RepID=A0ABM8V566_THEXY|nr:Protein of unknown function [Thermobacillus xylanilyticus]